MPAIKDAIRMDDEEFVQKFGFQKPGQDEGPPIVIHCMRGARAEMAHSTLRDLGFTNTKVYPGSYLDWVAKGGQVVKA